jgi:hypothetical protein
LISLAGSYRLNPLFKVFSLQGKDASKLAGNWLQLLMALFTKQYLALIVNTEQVKQYIP